MVHWEFDSTIKFGDWFNLIKFFLLPICYNCVCDITEKLLFFLFDSLVLGIIFKELDSM